jgi:general stress protein 26
MQDIKREILKIFSGKPVLASFATITEDGKPWVRYVSSVIDENDMSIRFATLINARKVQQIAKQPEVHLTCGVNNAIDVPEAYLQIQGKASFSTEKTERGMVWNDELKNIFKGIDDPNFGVIKVDPYRIEVCLFDNNTHKTLIWEK